MYLQPKSSNIGPHFFPYAYAPDSNLLASVSGPQHTTVYSYEDNRNVMTIVDNQAPGGSSSVSTYGYTYDALDRRSDRSQSGSAISSSSTDDFTYNSRSEVIASSNSVETAPAWNPTFAYDKIGNRLSSTGGTSSASSVSYTTNSLNQYTQVSGLSAQPSHDADGNLVASGAWTYTWNNENRLTSATNGTTTLNFTYDYQGRLVKKDDGSDVEVYVYDGWNRIATFRSQVSGLSLHETFLWGMDLSGSMQGASGVGGLLKETINEQQTTTNLYPTFDANGNIMQKLDGTGTVAMSVDYDPFGNIINGTLVGEYGFSTKPLIEGIQMYYYGFRYYDSVTGRWPSRDTLGEYGGLNLFGMLDNDSVNWVEALGLKKVQVTVSGTQPIKIPVTDTFDYTYDFEYKYYVLMDCSDPKNPTLAGYSADFKESKKGIKIPFSSNWIPVPKKYKKYKKAKSGWTGQFNYTSSVKNGLLSKGVDGDTTHEVGLEVDVGAAVNLDVELKIFGKVLWDHSVKRGGAVTFKTIKARFSCEEKCEKDEGEK